MGSATNCERSRGLDLRSRVRHALSCHRSWFTDAFDGNLYGADYVENLHARIYLPDQV